LIEADEYTKELSRYIHLNPVRAGMVGKPEEYEWSSYRHYMVERNAPEWLNRNFILGYFSEKQLRAMKLYCEFVDSSIDQEYENPLADISNSVILGGNEFIAEIKDRFLGDQKADRDLPALRNLSTRTSFDDIEEAVDSAFPSDKKLARQVKLYFCHRYSGRKLKEIGDRFGIGLSGVTRANDRICLKAGKDKKTRQHLEKN